VQSASCVRGLWHRLNPEGQEDYADHWFRLDPRMRYIRDNPGTRLLHDYLHTPESEIDRDPFYARYLSCQYTRYYVGGTSAPDSPFFCGFTLHRRGKLGPVTRGEFERFAHLYKPRRVWASRRRPRGSIFLRCFEIRTRAARRSCCGAC
jgi:hypothetical protein